MNFQSYCYKIIDDCEIKADVYWEDFDQLEESPIRHQSEDLCPIIVWIHGGALISGCRMDIRKDQLALYLSVGFVVVSIDYRLAPEIKLPSIISDVQDAFRWIHEDLPSLVPVDPTKITVIGHSAGGYLTLMAGFCVDPRPNVLIPFYGYGDISARWFSQPDPFYCQSPLISQEEAYKAIESHVITCGGGPLRGNFYLYCRQNGLWPWEVAGIDPNTQDELFDPYCPIRNVTSDYPPTLLLHGDKDTDVPFEQSQEMAAEIIKKGGIAELVIIPGGGHGFDGKGIFDPIIGPYFTRVIDFILNYLHLSV